MATTYQSYLWYIENDLSEYEGRWVCIVDKQVVAAGEDPKKILEETKAKTTKRPFLAWIPQPRLRIL